MIKKPPKMELYSVRTLKRYLNEKNLIHGRETATISKFGASIFVTYLSPDLLAVTIFELSTICLENATIIPRTSFSNRKSGGLNKGHWLIELAMEDYILVYLAEK